MAISLFLRDENRRLVRDSDCSYVPCRESYDNERFPMLGVVDPYGDAIFNGRQREMLLVEASQLLRTELSEKERDSLEAVIDLCHDARSRPGIYLWFVGD